MSKKLTRIEKMNLVVDVIAPSCRTTGQAAAVFVMFRYADHPKHKGHGDSTFQLSAGKLGELINVSEHYAKQIFNELRLGGVVKQIEPRRGTIPAIHQFTGHKFKSPDSR